MSRFLLTLLAMLALGVGLNAQPTKVFFPIRAWTTGITAMWDGTPLQFYGFSKGLTTITLPGPTIVVNEGDTLEVPVRNSSQQSDHTIHWHGLDVDQANDGVPHTSASIPHSQSRTYTFVATHAGTYIYHCHVLSVLHVHLGMYGSIVVRAANGANEVWTGGPDFDREYNWLTSEIDTDWFDSIPLQHGPNDSMFMTIRILPYSPNYFLVNGKSENELADSSIAIQGYLNETVHLRLTNMGYSENQVIFPAGLNVSVVASDGRPLPTTLAWDTLLVRPGERYSVLLTGPGGFEDSICIAYRDMDNGAVRGRQCISVKFSNAVARPEPATAQLGLMVYPQPADDIAYVAWEKPVQRGGQYRLVRMDGTLLQAGEIAPGRNGLNLQLDRLPAGIYRLALEIDGHQGQTQVAVMR